MYENGLLLGGFNPLHYGHIELFKLAFQRVKKVDFLVGNKPNYHLSREIRVQSLETTLKELNFNNNSTILKPQPSILEYKPENYDVLIIGSDVLNSLTKINSKISNKTGEKGFFSSFENLLILQRLGNELTKQALEFGEKNYNLEIHNPITSISASQIRNNIFEDKYVSHLLPDYVSNIIKPQIHLFKKYQY